MKLLKAVMTGALSVLLLGAPLGNLPIDSGINRVEASTQVKAMYAKTQIDAYKGRSSKDGWHPATWSKSKKQRCSTRRETCPYTPPAQPKRKS